jgi:hypothetical protein
VPDLFTFRPVPDFLQQSLILARSFHRLDDHFGMGITEVRAINPFSKTDWEGTGAEPDVKVKVVDAIVTAEKLAESTLRKK